MDNFDIVNQMKKIYCGNCDLEKECRRERYEDCETYKLMIAIQNLNTNGVASDNSEGCHICNRHKDIFFDDGRGGFRIAEYCPNCGKYID